MDRSHQVLEGCMILSPVNVRVDCHPASRSREPPTSHENFLVCAHFKQPLPTGLPKW